MSKTNNDRTRSALVRELQQSPTPEAWEELYTMLSPLAHAWAKRSGLPMDFAVDVLHTTMYDLATHIERFEPGKARLRTWIQRIFHHKAVEEIRRQARHRPQQNDEAGEAWPEPARNVEAADPLSFNEAEMDRDWLHAIMGIALAGMYKRIRNDKKRTAIQRYVLNGEDARSVSEDLGIKTSALFQQKSHALDLLREEALRVLRTYGIDHTTLGPALGDDVVARKAFRRELKDYIVARRAGEETTQVAPPPAELFEHVAMLDAINRHSPPPGDGQWLLAIEDSAPRWHRLDRRLTIGRDDTCDLQLSADGVSRQHAAAEPDTDDSWQLIDAESSNGIYCNGQARDRVRLVSGDWLRLGEANLVYVESTG